MLLVPEHRRREADLLINGASSAGDVATGTLTWDDVVRALRSGAPGDRLLLDDIRQFEGLCERRQRPVGRTLSFSVVGQRGAWTGLGGTSLPCGWDRHAPTLSF